MTRPSARRAVALAAVVAALAGCSTSAGGGAPTGTTVSIRQQVTPIYRELAQCFRDHGYPGFPDPVVKDDGTVEPFPEEVERNLDRLEATLRRHCEPIFNRLPASVREGSGGKSEAKPFTPAEVDKLRRFATCMRRHGLPEWPDPRADGTFPIPDQIIREGKSPRLLNAMRSCRDLNPDPKGGIRG